ncbi:hypothetical protein [Hydrogenophaga sp. H7]|uniref:hypothetical protein n=1 Tax=Hydrogenophaga sp. H7 TaxID=1882399 RepID=UPI001179AF9C|nr:hypothetical protein [Hydrogenophaga sp. H7]
MIDPNETREQFRERVLSGLEVQDNKSREARADRYVWANFLPRLPSAMVGRFEQFRLMDEARSCYIEGLYAATLILSFSVVEHSLDEESLFAIGKTSADKPKKGERKRYAIPLAEEAGTLPKDLLNRCDALREKRNALAHFRLGRDENVIVARAKKASMSPYVVLEEDAKEALALAREVFVATLRPFEV